MLSIKKNIINKKKKKKKKKNDKLSSNNPSIRYDHMMEKKNTLIYYIFDETAAQ